LETLRFGFRRTAPSPRDNDGEGAASRLFRLSKTIRAVVDRDAEKLIDGLGSMVGIFIEYTPRAPGDDVACRVYQALDRHATLTIMLDRLCHFYGRDLRQAFATCYAADPQWWDGVEYCRIGVRPMRLTAHRRLALAAAASPKLSFAQRLVKIMRRIKAPGRRRWRAARTRRAGQ
jgi:hypothetical protein